MRNYVKPMMECEEFATNEYVAACSYFSGTNIVIQQPFSQTDGKSDTPEQKLMGFSDDEWDFLAGQEDTMKEPNKKGWYCKNNNYPIHKNSPQPEFVSEGPWGNHVIEDMASDIYYYGGGPYPITKDNCKQYGVGPNAS